MPNRILKESICTSDQIDALTWFDEVVWYRLIVNCDDYGRMDGRPAVLKSRLFPLKGNVTDKSVMESIHHLATAGLVMPYKSDGKPHLQIATWDKHQQVRAKRSKYPAPPEPDITCNPMISEDSICARNPIQSESESEYESESETDRAAKPQAVADAFNRICTSMPKVSKLTDKRIKQIKAKHAELPEFESVFAAAQASDFLSGRSGKWSGCGFDWLLLPANWQKVLEGNYGNKTAQKPDRFAKLKRMYEEAEE